jgi:hypothetical protein
LKWVHAPEEEISSHVDRLDDGTPVYVAEEILGVKVDLDGKVRYKVKWQNFPRGDSTFEPTSSFLDDAGLQMLSDHWLKLGTSKKEGEKALLAKHKASRKNKRARR